MSIKDNDFQNVGSLYHIYKNVASKKCGLIYQNVA